jgi:hypothetical protein
MLIKLKARICSPKAQALDQRTGDCQAPRPLLYRLLKLFSHFEGMGYSKIFRNRWFAVIWAAGILWFAYDVATDSKEAREAQEAVSGSADNASSPANFDNQSAEMAKMVEDMTH